MPVLQVGKLMVAMATVRILFKTRLIAAVQQVGGRTNLVLHITGHPRLCVAMGVHLLTFDVTVCVFHTHGAIQAGIWVICCVCSIAS